jgi:hypothetical protein
LGNMCRPNRAKKMNLSLSRLSRYVASRSFKIKNGQTQHDKCTMGKTESCQTRRPISYGNRIRT